ncbi:MAG: hypothetical protein ABI663_07620 [Chryseolinea sp.]
MKIHLLLIIPLVAVSCNQHNNSTGETADSTQVPIDTVVSKTQDSVEPVHVDEAGPDEPSINSSALTAPEFNFDPRTISTDNRENKIVDKLAQLVEQYKEEKYATIRMSYTHDDAVGMGKINEDETWYYNANRQLCAFSSTFTSARTSRSSFYICSDGELLAVNSDNDFQDEGPRAYTSVRIVSSLCPLCGLTLSKEEEEPQEYQAYPIDQSSLDQYATDLFTKHEDMLNNFKEVTNLTEMGERYNALVLVYSDTIKYSVDPNLVDEFFKKGLTQK